MTQLSSTKRERWELLPYLLPLLVLVILGIIVYTSGQRIVSTATQLAKEDATIMNWWHEDQRETLNGLAGMLAQRLSVQSDLGDLTEAASLIGLPDDVGYVAWIDAEKTERVVLNAPDVIGDPIASKLFAFAPAVGQPSGGFWHEAGQPYWMSMAPVPPEVGGGVVVIQRPITADTVSALAALTERNVLFYSFETQAPLLSSSDNLFSDPPWLYPEWVTAVATGQLPDSIHSRNYQTELIVGMFAFPDFARLSYSGYFALVEPVGDVQQMLPQVRFWLLTALATVLMAVGAFLLHRLVRTYLQNRPGMSLGARRMMKLRMVAVTVLFLLPTLLVAGYIVMQTSNRSAAFDLRTARVAKEVLMATADTLTARINLFAAENTAQTFATDAPDVAPEIVAERVRLAHGLGFVVMARADGPVQASVEELNADSVAALQSIDAGTVDIVTVGKTVMLAARQSGGNGTAAVAGVRFNRYLPRIEELSGVDLTVFQEREPLYTTLATREIDSLYFDEAVEAELAQYGQASYRQKVGWNPGNLTIYGLNLGDSLDKMNQWRLVISQASITWANAVRGYQGFSLALIALVLVVTGAILMTLLNLDKPLLLRRLYTGYFFILPAVIWLVWWQLGPALFTGYLSFHKWSVLSPAKPFVGLHNYQQIWGDDLFWNAMMNTFIYVTQIPLGMALALALALALNRPLRGIRVLRTVYYMPAVTSIVVVSLMWKLLYNKDLGIFNYLLSFIGLGPYGFLQSTTMALPSIMAMSIWLGLGARMILFLAGLQSISNDYYEAADVDGANGWSKFRHITLPLLAPTTFFVFITSVINSFQVFGPVYVLTQGGPAGASDVAVHRIYFEAWQNLRFGYASAETVILFAFLFVVTAVQFRYFGRNVSYG